jgi:hypothetical protein
MHLMWHTITDLSTLDGWRLMCHINATRTPTAAPPGRRVREGIQAMAYITIRANSATVAPETISGYAPTLAIMLGLTAEQKLEAARNILGTLTSIQVLEFIQSEYRDLLKEAA